MASIVAYIELREGALTSPSRFLVAEARRVADTAGATVFALLMVGPLAQVEMDKLASEVSAAGADRILCSSSDTLVGPALDVTHGTLLTQVAEHLRPLLFLFPAGGVGAQLGPPLAMRIGAAYMANASVAICSEDRTPEPPSQRVLVSRWRAARDSQRKIDVGDLERPVVASLASGSWPLPTGEPYAEVEMVPCPDSKFPDAGVVGSEVDGTAHLDLCRAMVWSARSTATEGPAAVPHLPAGTCFVSAEESALAAVRVAAPGTLFLLPSASKAQAMDLASTAPGATIAFVASSAPASPLPMKEAEQADPASSAESELLELDAALARARQRGGLT